MDRSFLKGVVLGAGVVASAAAALLIWNKNSLSARGKPRPDAPGVDTAGVFKEGNVAVITGAGSGIGRETARQCARMKMKLVLADIDAIDLESAHNEISKIAASPADVLAVKTDVADLKSVEAMKNKAFSTFGAVPFRVARGGRACRGWCEAAHTTRIRYVGPRLGRRATRSRVIKADNKK